MTIQVGQTPTEPLPGVEDIRRGWQGDRACALAARGSRLYGRPEGL
jgi:hypothetical protein